MITPVGWTTDDHITGLAVLSGRSLLLDFDSHSTMGMLHTDCGVQGIPGHISLGMFICRFFSTTMKSIHFLIYLLHFASHSSLDMS